MWAIDFTEAPAVIDGVFPYLLAVRDLASGQQLLLLPLPEATSAGVVPALASLFVVLTLLLFYKHTENIKGLQAGTEGRIGAK